MIQIFEVSLLPRPCIHQCIFSIFCNVSVMICLGQGGLLSPSASSSLVLSVLLGCYVATMGSDPGQVEFWVRSTSVKVVLVPNMKIAINIANAKNVKPITGNMCRQV